MLLDRFRFASLTVLTGLSNSTMFSCLSGSFSLRLSSSTSDFSDISPSLLISAVFVFPDIFPVRVNLVREFRDTAPSSSVDSIVSLSLASILSVTSFGKDKCRIFRLRGVSDSTLSCSTAGSPDSRTVFLRTRFGVDALASGEVCVFSLVLFLVGVSITPLAILSGSLLEPAAESIDKQDGLTRRLLLLVLLAGDENKSSSVSLSSVSSSSAASPPESPPFTDLCSVLEQSPELLVVLEESAVLLTLKDRADSAGQPPSTAAGRLPSPLKLSLHMVNTRCTALSSRSEESSVSTACSCQNTSSRARYNSRRIFSRLVTM